MGCGPRNNSRMVGIDKGKFAMKEFTTVGQTAAETVNVSKQALVDSFTQAWSQVIMLAPKLVAMVSVLVIGYVLARWVASIITVVSEKARSASP